MKAGREVAVFRDRLYICIFKSTPSTAGCYFAFSKTSIIWRYTRSMPARQHKFSFRGRGPFERWWTRYDSDCFRLFWTRALFGRRYGIKFLIYLVVERIFWFLFSCGRRGTKYFFLKVSFCYISVDNRYEFLRERIFRILENFSSFRILEIQFLFVKFNREHETTAVEMFFRLSTGIN